MLSLRYCSVVIWLSYLCYSVQCDRYYYARGYGNAVCRMEDGRIKPLQEVLVKLMDDDGIFHDTFGSGRSNINGRFDISGHATDGWWGKPEPYIEVKYDYGGTHGRMEVDGLFGVTRSFRTNVRGYSNSINFGNIVISDDHCRAYVYFRDVLRDYYQRTHTRPPYGTLNVNTQVVFHGGTAFAERGVVNIPKGYRLSDTTAQHEIAHTVRHTLDGNYGHFLHDVIRFGYPRIHYCSTLTNQGFAFNEGFAEFWAGQCTATSYGSSPTDYRIEGNVANALRDLKSSCGLSYNRMISILRRNKERIHSFNDFKRYSGCNGNSG